MRAEALAKKAALRRLRGAAATRASRRATVRAARRTFVQVRRPRVEQKENAASRTPLACVCEPCFKCRCFFAAGFLSSVERGVVADATSRMPSQTSVRVRWSRTASNRRSPHARFACKARVSRRATVRATRRTLSGYTLPRSNVKENIEARTSVTHVDQHFFKRRCFIRPPPFLIHDVFFISFSSRKFFPPWKPLLVLRK